MIISLGDQVFESDFFAQLCHEALFLLFFQLEDLFLKVKYLKATFSTF